MKSKPKGAKHRNLYARGPLLALVGEVRRLRGALLGVCRFSTDTARRASDISGAGA